MKAEYDREKHCWSPVGGGEYPRIETKGDSRDFTMGKYSVVVCRNSPIFNTNHLQRAFEWAGFAWDVHPYGDGTPTYRPERGGVVR